MVPRAASKDIKLHMEKNGDAILENTECKGNF